MYTRELSLQHFIFKSIQPFTGIERGGGGGGGGGGGSSPLSYTTVYYFTQTIIISQIKFVLPLFVINSMQQKNADSKVQGKLTDKITTAMRQ